jgi:hypothetical protein
MNSFRGVHSGFLLSPVLPLGEIMKKFIVTGAIAFAALSSVPAFAIDVNIPGFGSGSMGSEIKNSTVNVMGNKASNITNGGGSGSAGPVSINMSAETNVNSVVLKGSKITDSTVNVMGNTADTVTNIGGAANVNSVVLQ